MTIARDDIDTIKKANGAESTMGSPPTDDDPDGEAPYGMTLIGAINVIDRIAGNMDTYGLSYSDLSADLQDEFDRAHEAVQWHVSELSNALTDGFVGTDGSIELENGNTVDLPRAALSASSSKDLPNRPN